MPPISNRTNGSNGVPRALTAREAEERQERNNLRLIQDSPAISWGGDFGSTTWSTRIGSVTETVNPTPDNTPITPNTHDPFGFNPDVDEVVDEEGGDLEALQTAINTLRRSEQTGRWEALANIPELTKRDLPQNHKSGKDFEKFFNEKHGKL